MKVAVETILPRRGQAVFFDAGNTLLHLDHAFLARQIARRNRDSTLRITPVTVGYADAEVLRYDWKPRMASTGSPDSLATYLNAICSRLDLPTEVAAAVVKAAVEEHRSRPLGLWSQPDPEAAEVLTHLREYGFRLGVISNNDGQLGARLKGVGLAHYFEAVIDSGRAGVEKPDPRIFGLGLRELGLPAEACAYVGDSLDVDIRGAEAVGMTGILYDRWGVWRDVPCRRIKRLSDLTHGLMR